MVHKVREAIELVTRDGWLHVGTKGSHRQYRHPTKAGRVTIAGKESKDLPEGTWRRILAQAGLQERKP